MAESNCNVCVTAGEKGDGAVPRRRKIMSKRERLADEDLKETGNGFIFTTHFALRLTFGRGADVSPCARQPLQSRNDSQARR